MFVARFWWPPARPREHPLPDIVPFIQWEEPEPVWQVQCKPITIEQPRLATWHEELPRMTSLPFFVQRDMSILELLVPTDDLRNTVPSPGPLPFLIQSTLPHAVIHFPVPGPAREEDWDYSDLESLLILISHPKAELGLPSHRCVLDPAPDMRATENFEEICSEMRPAFAYEFPGPEVLEGCFPVVIFEDSETFVESITVPFLEFQVRSTIALQPLSSEWLQELQIPTDTRFLALHYEAGIKTTLGLATDMFPVNEIFSALLIHNPAQADFEGRTSAIPAEETTFVVDSLPRTLCVNSAYFSADDIRQFADLFPGILVKPDELESPVLMQIGAQLLVFLDLGEHVVTDRLFIDGCVKFDQILGLSTSQPPFVGIEKVKWRCITSLRHLAAAVFPFLQ
jgi:hypothetical protein